MTDEKKTDIMSYGLFAMVITHALVHAAGAMRNSILPLVKEEFFLTNTQVGLIAAVPPLAQALLSIPAGYWSDRYGAKRLVALSIGMAVIGAILGGVTWSPWVFIVATTLLTLNSTFYHPPSHSYVARLVRRVDRSKALGFLNAGGTFGIAVGPLSITLVIEWLGFSWRELYLFWVMPISLGFVILYFVREISREDSVSGREIEGDATTLWTRGFIVYLTSRGIRMFAMGMMSAFIAIYLTEVRGWSIGQVGIMYGASSLLGIFASPVGGEISSRVGNKKWAVISLGIGYAFLLGAFFTSGIYSFMAMYLSYRFFGILAMPAMASITAALTPPKQMGMGYALSFMPASIAGVIATPIAGYIADFYGYFPIFMISVVILYTGLAVLQIGVKIRPTG